MSFFNPFRKNQRPDGVKLSSMQAPEDAGRAVEPQVHAEPTFGPRTEPSFGSAKKNDFANPFEKPAKPADAMQESAAPPAFEFAESAPAFDMKEPSAAKASPDAFSAAFEASQTPDSEKTAQAEAQPFAQAFARGAQQPPQASFGAAGKPKAAPWDPYGIKTAQPETPAADRAEPSFGPAFEAPAQPAAAPFVMTEPKPDFEGNADAGKEEFEAAKPVLKPVPREQVREQVRAQAERTTMRPERRPLSDAELLARRRTKHRMVGAAVLLMAAVVAAPFVIDNEPPIDTSKLDSISTDIPKESETTTALNVPPVPRKDLAHAGDFDVSDTSLGRKQSTAKANLAREAESTREAVEAPVKTVTAGKAEKVEKPAVKPAAESSDVKKADPPKKPLKSAGITPPTGKGWFVQVVATSNEEAAERVVKKLALLGLPAYRTNEGGNLWKVRVGLYGDKNEAEGARGTIVLNGVAQKPYLGQNK